MITIDIGKNEANQRLDKFLRKYLNGAPLSRIYKIIRKDAKINGRRSREEYLLQEGDQLSLYLSEEELKSLHKERKAKSVRRTFTVVYEDERILVVNKPAGLLTHGDQHEKKNHLTNQVIDYLIQKGDYQPRLEKTFVPAPVNRLDRNTSGLVIFGKDYQALQTFHALIKEHRSIRKFYQTIALGAIDRKLELRDSMVKDEKRNRVTLSREAGAKAMLTFVTPLTVSSDRLFTLAEIEIVTGRTHQIRVQLAGAGHPLLGDPKYGLTAAGRKAAQRLGVPTQLLHAGRLELQEMPEEFAYLNGKAFTAPLPGKFQRAAEQVFDLSEIAD